MTADEPSIAPGYALERGHGVVLFRVEHVNGSGEPDKAWELVHPRRLELAWRRLGNEEDVVLHPAENGIAADFYVAPVSDRYRIVLDSFVARPFPLTRRFLLEFSVQPGEVVYAGTIRFYHDYLRNADGFTLRDDYDATVARFREIHPELAANIRKALFDKYLCPLPGVRKRCEWQAWGEGGSP